MGYVSVFSVVSSIDRKRVGLVGTRKGQWALCGLTAAMLAVGIAPTSAFGQTQLPQNRSIRPGGAGWADQFVGPIPSWDLPPAPTPRQPTYDRGAIQVRYEWSNVTDAHTGFRVFRERQDGVEWVDPTVLNIPGSQVVLLDTPPVTGTYQYRVQWVSGPSGSQWSNPLPIVVDLPTPPMPSSLTAQDLGMAQAVLNWSDNSNTEQGFVIEREPAFQSGQPWRTSPNITAYIDSCGGGTFSYRVSAFNANGESAFTEWSTVTVGDIVPAGPSGLLVQEVGDDEGSTLSWTDQSNNEAWFIVERKAAAAPDNEAATQFQLEANTTTMNDTPGLGTFKYRVSAGNSAGSSAWTSWVYISIGFAPNQPAPVITVLNSTSQRMAPHTVFVHATNSYLGNMSYLWQRAKLSWDFGDTSGSPLTTTDPRTGRIVDVSREQEGFNAAYVYQTPGTYTIRLRITNEVGQSAETTTQVTVAANTRSVRYVDAVAGNDTFDGATPATAWRSYATAVSRAANNRTILLKRGQVFPVTETVSMGLFSNVMIDTYGEGAKPELRGAGTGVTGVLLTNVAGGENLVVRGLRFDAPSLTLSQTRVDALNLVALRNVVWDCEFGRLNRWVSMTRAPIGTFILNSGSTEPVREFAFPTIGNDYCLVGVQCGGSVTETILRVMPWNTVSSQRVSLAWCDLHQNDLGKGYLRFGSLQWGTVMHSRLLGGAFTFGHNNGDTDYILVFDCELSNGVDSCFDLKHNAMNIRIEGNSILWRAVDYRPVMSMSMSFEDFDGTGCDMVEIINNDITIEQRTNYSPAWNLMRPEFEVTNLVFENNRYNTPANYNKAFINVRQASNLLRVSGNTYRNFGDQFGYAMFNNVAVNWTNWLALPQVDDEHRE
jgi:hypothetical protein